MCRIRYILNFCAVKRLFCFWIWLWWLVEVSPDTFVEMEMRFWLWWQGRRDGDQFIVIRYSTILIPGKCGQSEASAVPGQHQLDNSFATGSDLAAQKYQGCAVIFCASQGVRLSRFAISGADLGESILLAGLFSLLCRCFGIFLAISFGITFHNRILLHLMPPGLKRVRRNNMCQAK